MDLQQRAAALVGFPIRAGTVLVMTCPTGGQDHHGREHEMPAGALAIVGGIEMIGGSQGLGFHLSIPLDPSLDFDDPRAAGLSNTFDEGDDHGRFAFREATDAERAGLHDSWLRDLS